MARRGRWGLVRIGKARTGRRGGALRENDWTSRQRHGLAGKDRCVMTWKALEWHGIAGTEWRMQVGGERLGRVGIAVAGMESSGGV